VKAKITEPLRSARLRRPLVPSVTKDADTPGLALHVTTRRAFWALSYQPKGVNPSTGKRWGGGVRHELGDAMLMTVAEARTAALAAKALVQSRLALSGLPLRAKPRRAIYSEMAAVITRRIERRERNHQCESSIAAIVR